MIAVVDNSTEEELDTIEDRLQYRHWFCGHYHTEKAIERLQFFYKTSFRGNEPSGIDKSIFLPHTEDRVYCAKKVGMVHS